jgi:GNAT superfamily N-acetyltransferase
MNILHLTQQDGPHLYDVWLRGVGEHPEAFGATVEEFQRVPADEFTARNLSAPDRFVVLGAWLDRELVGFVALGRDLRAKLRHMATLGPIYVVPEARGRGIGAALLDAAVTHLRGLSDVSQLKLAVAVGNMPARQLYRRSGFVPYGVEPNGMRIGAQFVDMELLSRPIRAPGADAL